MFVAETSKQEKTTQEATKTKLKSKHTRHLRQARHRRRVEN